MCDRVTGIGGDLEIEHVWRGINDSKLSINIERLCSTL